MSFTALDATKIVHGPYELTYNSIQLGFTEEEPELEFGDSIVRLMAHEAGDVPIKIVKGPVPVIVRVPAIQLDSIHFENAVKEGTVTSAGLVTVTQDFVTNLAGATLRIHPSIEGSGVTKDFVFYNMAPSGVIGTIKLSRTGKAVIGLAFERIFKTTGTAWTFGSAAA